MKKEKDEDHPFYSDSAVDRWGKRKKGLELEEKLQHQKAAARFKHPSKKEELDGNKGE